MTDAETNTAAAQAAPATETVKEAATGVETTAAADLAAAKTGIVSELEALIAKAESAGETAITWPLDKIKALLQHL